MIGLFKEFYSLMSFDQFNKPITKFFVEFNEPVVKPTEFCLRTLLISKIFIRIMNHLLKLFDTRHSVCKLQWEIYFPFMKLSFNSSMNYIVSHSSKRQMGITFKIISTSSALEINHYSNIIQQLE